MKKLFFIAVAAMAIAACTKTEVNGPKLNVIGFQPANSIETKVTGTQFPTTETFGTYAWTEGTTGDYFIENKEVSFTGGVWTTATPYYWPKNQSVDFFSYYPYNATGAVPVVGKTQINYNNVNFESTQLDIMYADKAVAFTDNADQVQVTGEDAQSALTGVPTFFRHAGAKVKVNVILGVNTKNETDGSVTKWEVHLKSIVLSGLYIQGSCQLNLATTPTTGLVPWVKPNGNVWTNATLTNDITKEMYKSRQEYDLVPNEGVEAIPSFYVLPQTLAADQQRASLVFDVDTYRKAAGQTEFVKVLHQENLEAKTDLRINTSDLNQILAWEMNQNIVYNITIGPAGKQITFDPAVDAWENKTVSTNIELEI